METAPLRSFAAWARTALIREVSARIAVVLASQELRLEQPNAVAALEKAVIAAGGGVEGRDVVADKVAYTWFNRIIALRFMDANGYTGIGIISPEPGRGGGQPEVLAEAKRGNIDSTVVTNKHTVETITSLLNGTRRSDDPQGEAYSLLLAEYCRYWNRSMPFMFEREGDYTELLIPANLLAEDSVLARAVTVLTWDVCRDVEVIGWLYQFYISERKDEVFAGFKMNKKAGAAEIPAATQLFTPHWIVRYLVENSLGRLWLLNRPTSRLTDQMDYYIVPIEEEPDYLTVSSPEELKIIDPACGSGHMLTYAFDLLYAIYEEEGYAPSDIPGLILTNNLHGTEIDPRAGALAAFALTMKARARQRTFLNKQIEPNVCVLEPISFTPTELDLLVTHSGDRGSEEAFWNQFEQADVLGSLIRPEERLIDPLKQHLRLNPPIDLVGQSIHDRAARVLEQSEYLSRRYNILVANPPYMGSANMGAELANYTRVRYPQSKNDLMTAFMQLAAELVKHGGWWAMINLPSWMFLRSFTDLRAWSLSTQSFSSLVHLGRGIFGSDFGSVAFVVRNAAPSPDHVVVCRRLFEQLGQVRTPSKIAQLFLTADYNRREVAQVQFTRMPDSAFAYWATENVVQLFERAVIRDVATIRRGISTGNNGKYVRYWFEISQDNLCTAATDTVEAASSRRRWFPYNRGGEFRKWYGFGPEVIDYRNNGERMIADRDAGINPGFRHDGQDTYFRSTLTWSAMTSGRPSFRYLPHGFVLGHKGASISSARIGSWNLLGLLNSSSLESMLELISSTRDITIGQIQSLPLPPELSSEVVTSAVKRAVEISRNDAMQSEISWEYEGNALLRANTAQPLESILRALFVDEEARVEELQLIETSLNEAFSRSYFGQTTESDTVKASDITLESNRHFAFAGDVEGSESLMIRRRVEEMVSYAVGCMFGRYSLDEPGQILANHGDTLQDYLAKVPSPTFTPDQDNVIPIVDGDWFEDDIVARFRQFLRVAFGEEHFEDNLRFVMESLGVKDLRDYFVKSFYKDHVQRYKKRPIYWLFSSPKGSFNALIYMHRYTASTISTVLNEYLREYKAKLAASREHHERLAAGTGAPRHLAAAQKEVDRLRKILLELDEYEHDVLYPLATQQVQIDLDAGVKANYPKLGAALKKIPGLEASDE